METFAHYAAKPLPCSVPLAVVLYGAGNHQPDVKCRKCGHRFAYEPITQI